VTSDQWLWKRMLIGIGFALSAVVNEKMARLSGEASPATFFPIATERTCDVRL
jgi:hypothetical protein